MRVLSFIHCRYLNRIRVSLFQAAIAKGLSQRVDCWKQRIFNVMRVRLKQGYVHCKSAIPICERYAIRNSPDAGCYIRMTLPTIRACFRVYRRLYDFPLPK